MFKDPQNWFLPCSKPRNSGDKMGWLMTSSQEQIQHYAYYVVKKQSLCSLGKNYRIIKYFCCAKLVLNKVPFLHHFVLEVRLSQIILCGKRQYFFLCDVFFVFEWPFSPSKINFRDIFLQNFIWVSSVLTAYFENLFIFIIHGAWEMFLGKVGPLHSLILSWRMTWIKIGVLVWWKVSFSFILCLRK